MESNLTFITLGSKTLHIRECVHAKSLQSCPTRCDPMDCSPPGSSVHGDSPGKNAGVVFHALLQGIFLTQGSNPCLLHCRWVLYLSHGGGPYKRIRSVQFTSVAQMCLILCSPMDCSTPGLPVHHQLLEFTQTHVH